MWRCQITKCNWWQRPLSQKSNNIMEKRQRMNEETKNSLHFPILPGYGNNWLGHNLKFNFCQNCLQLSNYILRYIFFPMAYCESRIIIKTLINSNTTQYLANPAILLIHKLACNLIVIITDEIIIIASKITVTWDNLVSQGVGTAVLYICN